MSTQNPQLTDFARILLGEAPVWFLIEAMLRGILMYLLLLFAMRLMGRRVGGQMSTAELAVVVTLGAAVGLPIQAPDIGVLAAVVILFIAVVYQRGITFASQHSRRFEVVTQGRVTIVVRDGRVDRGALSIASISNDRLFSDLRGQHILQLGEVRRVYLEASGQFSVLRFGEERPGLSLMPEGHAGIHELERDRERSACTGCGNVVEHREAPAACAFCHETRWAPAYRHARKS